MSLQTQAEPSAKRCRGASAPVSHCWAIGFLVIALLITACLPLDSTLPTETPRPTDAAPATQTIVWFPPSATATLLTVATYTATPEMSPGIGQVTLRDNFSDKSVWDTATSDQGSAVISRNLLALTVQPGYYLSSTRHKTTLSDFYAEITAHPSLCRGGDNYGILVRGVGSYFYRFVLTCDGQVRAERVNGGTKLLIHEPVPSGDAPGAPGEVRIGIWAVKSEIRLFLNGRYQFNITDNSFPSGALGVYVRSAGDTPVTVVFSDLSVYAVNYTLPTRTPIP
ncbi:MAG TPA: hypothetical protein VK249_26735 [Anaerolineales bacterium]|nr:hypothetical protein [Anaerolineales bacterium]